MLSIDEVRQLIGTVRTLRHRTYFWTVYSMGLRLSEGLHLQVGDIDGARMLVHVHRGKGAKVRFVPLPARTLALLREYWVTHRHAVWLFPAIGSDRRQAASSDRPIVKNGVQDAMRRVVGPSHGASSIADSCLRNSSGVSLRNSQKLNAGNFKPSRPYGV